ncbi:MAG: hypothetical protein JWM89_765 [Acidimicrobiales bacterium]|nr:hypothetical protein [Acidimicrobiales bacterium]
MDEPGLIALRDRLVLLHQRELAGVADDADEDVDFSSVASDRKAALVFALELPVGGAEAAERSARADLLGAVVNGAENDLVGPVLEALLAMLEAEQEPYVLTSIAYALGHSWDERARDALLDLATQVDDDVRLAAVHGLPGTRAHSDGPDGDTPVVDALVRSTRDPVAEIRNWATFGLGQIEAEGPEVDQAFLDRFADPDDDTRSEALRAMADRRDERVVEPLIAELRSQHVEHVVVGAAGWFADQRFHGVLLDLAAMPRTDDDDQGWWAELDAAIRRCDPGAPAAAEPIEVAILAVLQASASESGHPIDATLFGEYPLTEVVITHGDREERSAIWNFDERRPDSPASLDQAFTFYRLANIASWI